MVSGSLRVLRLSPPLKTGCHDITESGIKHNKSNQNQIIECTPPYTLLQKVHFYSVIHEKLISIIIKLRRGYFSKPKGKKTQ
jgi:hypothetical protein